MRQRALVVPVLGALVLASCAGPSAWEANLVRGPEGVSTSPLSTGAEVRVRQVPFERVARVLHELEREIASSDVPPEEWTPDQQAASKASLLRALQVTTPPQQVLVVGRSAFNTTDPLPDEEDLRRLARRVGADTVVWSSRVVRQVDKIVERPASSNTYGTRYRTRDGSGREPDTYHETTTTWVPMRVTADEVGAIAYFLRTN